MFAELEKSSSSAAGAISTRRGRREQGAAPRSQVRRFLPIA